MWKNILYMIVGAVTFAVLVDRPIFAQNVDFSNAGFAISGREVAILDRSEGIIYYYEKSNGQFLRAHEIKELGTSMTPPNNNSNTWR